LLRKNKTVSYKVSVNSFLFMFFVYSFDSLYILERKRSTGTFHFSLLSQCTVYKSV
jgi:hypothetical protein